MKIVTVVLLALAGGAAVVRTVTDSQSARVAAATLAGCIILACIGVLRASSLALGLAFFGGLFTLWAVIALGLRHDLSAEGALTGIVWSIALMVTSVRSRPVRSEREGLHAQG